MDYTKNIFELLRECLRASTKYNIKKKSLEINHQKLNKKIDTVLDAIGCPYKKKGDIEKHIKLACVKIVDEAMILQKDEDMSFARSISKIQESVQNNSNIILRFGYLQKSIFAKELLLKSLDKDSKIIPKFITNNTTDLIERIFYEMQFDTSNCIQSFKELDGIIKNLDQYIKDIKTPDWYPEISYQQQANINLGYDNLNSMEKVDKKISDILDMTGVNPDTKNAIKSSMDCATKVQDVMRQNNELLSKIALYIGAEKTSSQNVHEYLKKFQVAVAEGLVLKCLQSNDKILGKELQKLYIALQKPLKEFDTVEKIDLYMQSIEDTYASSKIDKVIEEVIDIEMQMSFETDIGKRIKELPEIFLSLKVDLVRHKNAIEKREGTTIEISDIPWERNGLQSFSTFFSSISKFFIGEQLHVAIYGYADGVEELRRASEKTSYKSDLVKQIDFEQFEADIWEVI